MATDEHKTRPKLERLLPTRPEHASNLFFAVYPVRSDGLIANDHEVLGLGSGIGHFFGIFFLLHDKLSR